MHEPLIRADQRSKGRRLLPAALSISGAAGLLFLSGLVYTAISATALPDADPMAVAALPNPQSSHEHHVLTSRHGNESLSLSARLDAEGGLITRPVTWRISRRTAGADAEPLLVYEKALPAARLETVPGDYVVEARYGHASLTHSVTIKSGQHVHVTLNLNVGAIRALSTVNGTSLPPGITVDHRIIAENGLSRGHQIAVSRKQGEVLRLAAGRYRIESRFNPGNTIARSQVKVRAGYMSGLHLAHTAGLAEIDAGNAEDTTLTIIDTSGTWRYRTAANSLSLVLAEGRYRIIAMIGGKERSRDFVIRRGGKTVLKLSDSHD